MVWWSCRWLCATPVQRQTNIVIPRRRPEQPPPGLKNLPVPIPSAEPPAGGIVFVRPPAGGAALCRVVHRARVWCPAREPVRQGTGVASLTSKKARHEPGAIAGSLAVSGQSCGPWPPDRGPSDVGGVRPRWGGPYRQRSGAHRDTPLSDLLTAPAPAEVDTGGLFSRALPYLKPPTNQGYHTNRSLSKQGPRQRPKEQYPCRWARVM